MSNIIELPPKEGEVLPDYKIPESLIKGVNTNYQKSQDASKQGMVYAIKTGEYLHKIKAKIPHGKWQKWIEKGQSDFPFSTYRQVKKYMKLAKNKELAHIVNNPDAVFNLDGIDKALAHASDKDKSEAARLKQIASMTSSNTDQWYTPAYILDMVRGVYGGTIDLDPCTTPDNVTQALTYFTEEDDGLKQEWKGKVFMNPPYGASVTHKWCDYMIEQDPEEAMILIRNSTGAEYFHRLMGWGTAILMFRGRIDFMAGKGQKSSQPTFSNIMFYKGDNLDAFVEHFKEQGVIFKLPPHSL